MSKLPALALFIAPLILAGCGGGGGGGGSTSLYDGPTTAITIDATSAEDTASKAYQESGASSLSSAGGDFIPYITKPGNELRQSTVDAAADIALDIVNFALNKKSSDNSTIPSVSGSENVSEVYCYSGKAVMSYDVNDPYASYPSPGDYIKLAFTDCDTGTSIYNGSVKMVFNSMDASTLDVSETFNNLSAVDSLSSDTFTMHGDMRIVVDMSTTTYQTSVTGSSFAAESMVSTVVSQMLLTNYSFDETYNTSTGDATGDYDYTIASTDLDGSISVETTTAFQIASGNTYPSAGVMVITGDSGSSIRLTAQGDATNVVLDQDFDGDGVYEYYNTVTWCSLDPDCLT